MTERLIEATPLLTALSADLNGKQSIQDCLRSRSLPCAVVKRALAQDDLAVDSQALQLTHSMILTRHLHAAFKQKATTSLQTCTLLAPVFCFVQYLLERMNRSVDEGDCGDNAINKEKLLEMVSQCLRTLVGLSDSLLKTVEANENGQDLFYSDATQSYNAIHVVQYIFGSLLRINHYVARTPPLLSPLWKALCEIASLVQVDWLPPDLLHEAVNALTDYACDGSDWLHGILSENSQTTSFNAGQLAFQTKMLAFLFARLLVFMRLVDKQSLTCKTDLPTAVNDALSTVCYLYGVLYALQSRDASIKAALQGLMSKIAKYFVSVWSTCMTSVKNLPAIEHLLNNNQESSLRKRKTPIEMICVGKAVLLTDLLSYSLERDELSEKHVDMLVELCFAIPSLLPLANHGIGPTMSSSGSGESLISYCLSVTTSVLVRAEIEYTLISPERRISWHCSVINLLNAGYNLKNRDYLSREYAVTSIYLYVLTLGKIGETRGFLSLCIALLVHEQTSRQLRQGLADLLVRVLRFNDKALADDCNQLLQQEVSYYFEKCDKDCKRKKRKRSSKSTLSAADSVTIVSVLLNSNVAIQDEKTNGITASRPRRCNPQDLLRMACMQRKSTSSTHLQSTIEISRRLASGQIVTGRDYAAVQVYIVLHKLTNMWTDRNKTTASLLHSALELIQYSLRINGKVALYGSALQCLTETSLVINDNMTKYDKTLLQGTFYDCLLATQWPHRSAGMTALVQFATRLPTSLKDLLIPCVPASMQKLIQYRLQGSLYASVESIEAIRAELMAYSKSVMETNLETRVGLTKTSATSESRIELGSYYIEMPTLEGRHAIVIFPANPQSLVDIRYMLGADEEDDLPVQTLRQVATLSKGGCRLYLE
jgi:hypothetical protein